MFDAGAIVFNIRAAGAQVFRQELSQADRAARELEKSVDETAKSTSKLGGEQDKTTKKTREQEKAQREAARAAAEYSAAQDKVGRVLVTAGAAIVGATVLTVKAAMEWESAWAGVTKTVDGTDEELANVQQGLRGLTHELPAAHDEIAAVAEAAGQLGVQTGSVVGFTRTMIDLGETTNLAATDAATALARFMNVMGTSQDLVSNLGSSVVALGNNYATTEAEIVSMATRLSGAAKQVGLTEGETMGLATALSSVGIEAEAGGSAVSKVMIDIAASVEEGGDRLQKFADISGVSATEFAAAWRKDPGAALALFVEGLANAEAQGQSTLGMLAELEITEVRMRDALLRAAAASDQFTDAMDLGNEAFAENNALQKEAEQRYKTVESQLGVMRNRINDAAIDLGSVFLPVVADAASAVGDFADWLAALPEPLQRIVAEGGLAVGTIALFTGAALLAIPKAMELHAEMKLLATTSPNLTAALRNTATFLRGPYGIALIGAVAGLMALQKWMESAKASSEELDNALRTADNAGAIFDVNMKGRDEWFMTLGTAINTLDDLDHVLETSARLSERWWERLGNSSNFAAQHTLKDIGDQLADLSHEDLPLAQNRFRMLARETDGTDRRLWQLLSTMPAYRDALIAQATAQGINITEMSEAERKAVLLELAQGKLESQTRTAKDEILEQADALDEVRSSLQQVTDALNTHNKIGQDAIDSNIDYYDALREVDEILRQIDEGAEGFARTLDITTEAGGLNMEALNKLAAAAWEAATAQLALDGDVEGFQSTLTAARERLISAAEAMGYGADEAGELADQILKIPTEKQIEVIVETSTAMGRLQRLQAQLNGVRTSAQQWEGYGRWGIEQADGGVVDFYANGGFHGQREHHVAQIARAGEYRVWAEPETGGEAYIPLAPSKRARSEAIMAETAARLGGMYIPSGAQQYADGSPVASVGSPRVVELLERIAAGLSRPNVSFVNPVSKDPVEDARQAAQMMIASSYV